jgi:type IV pilus assembly protein PilB
MLEEQLVARGLLTPEQVTHLRRRAEKENLTLEAVIKEERLVFPEALTQVKAELAGLPYVDLEQAKLADGLMKDISRQAAATYRFIPFREDNGELHVAMEDPDNFQALQAVKFIAKKRGLKAQIYLASGAGIDKILGITAQMQAEIGGALTEFSRELESAELDGKKGLDITQLIEEAPISKVVAVIIRHAIEGGASDIHIESTPKELRVRYRIDGRLHISLVLPLKMQAAIISRIKILSSLKIDESRLPQDGRFSTTTEGRVFDFRVSTMPTSFGEKVALRILDKSGGAPTFDDLGLWGKGQQVYRQHLKLPNGIILISGPTGSGKSTTLFTSLTLLNTTEVNISTLEDPVEYEIDGVNQTQIHPDIGLTFASGLRNLLRQDPDILMVGEIRDRETAELAVHASLTGHLVLSTIHTNDAIGAIPRLVDMGIDPFLLTASLRLLAAQRLVSRLCRECQEQKEIPASVLKVIKAELASVPEEYKTDANQKNPQVLYQGGGCPACQEVGSLGRLAIFEVVPVTKELRNSMNQSQNYDTLKNVALEQGSLTMRQDGILKALAGHILIEDVIRVTSENRQ